VDGETCRIEAQLFRVKGKGDALESDAQIGAGTVAGGVVRGVIGGGSGALKCVLGGASAPASRSRPTATYLTLPVVQQLLRVSLVNDRLAVGTQA
jgi:hypothetical protein